MAVRQQNDLRLYLDVIPDPSHVSSLSRLNCPLMLTCLIQPEIPGGSIMIFLKHFDVTRQSLYGIGKVYVSRSAKVADLYQFINEKMRWSAGTPLKLYEVNIQSLYSVFLFCLIPPEGN